MEILKVVPDKPCSELLLLNADLRINEKQILAKAK